MRNFSLFLIVSAVLAVAGCGGGSDSSSSTTAGVSGATGVSGGTPLSQDEFVSQANSICADVNSQIEGLTAPSNDMQSIADFTSQGLAILEPALQKLAALVPPTDLQDKYSQWLAAAQKSVKAQQQLHSAAENGDSATVQSLAQQIKSNNAADDQMATDLGLTECAKDVSPQG